MSLLLGSRDVRILAHNEGVHSETVIAKLPIWRILKNENACVF